ncbi:MAG: hypothetical protein IJ737_02195 [Ruminococcus sp.]|nr:hypothetical protein [Ruminococcus sp.]
MKKAALIFLLIIASVILVCCGKKSSETYYPDSSEMKKNLESKGYNTDVTEEDRNGSSCTVLRAEKGSEYIVFYWFSDDSCVDEVIKELKAKYENSYRLISIKNDKKFGDLAFCSTKRAMEDSGIVLTEVKV